MMHGYGYDMTALGWLLMLGGWIVLIGAIVLGALLIARALRDDRARRPTPLELLQERFARGEIDADAYEKAWQVLRSTGG